MKPYMKQNVVVSVSQVSKTLQKLQI